MEPMTPYPSRLHSTNDACSIKEHNGTGRCSRSLSNIAGIVFKIECSNSELVNSKPEFKTRIQNSNTKLEFKTRIQNSNSKLEFKTRI